MKLLRTLAVTALLAASLNSPARAELKEVTIGTNPSGSTFFLIGSSLAKMFQEKLDIRSTTQPFAGSSMYVPSVEIGDITLGVVNTVDAGLAYNGEADYPTPVKGIRALAYIWEIPYGFVVRADSDIMTADDLKGKRVMGDMPTTQALDSINRAIIASGGLDVSDVQYMVSGGLMDGLNALSEGRADAAPMATTMPVLTELNASIPGGLRVMGNGSAASEPGFFGKQVNGLSERTVQEADNRPFIKGETSIVTYGVVLAADADMSDDDAYLLTKAMYDNWAELQETTGPLRAIPQSALATTGTSIPYHPGAVKFFKEVGLWTEELEAEQATY